MIIPTGKRYIITSENGNLTAPGNELTTDSTSWVRVTEDREANPSAAIIDCQSVENGTMVSHSVGFDAGKLVKGRKRHLLVDTLGLVLMVVVTSAYESDQAGAKKLFAQAKKRISDRLTRLVCIWVDAGYLSSGVYEMGYGYKAIGF